MLGWAWYRLVPIRRGVARENVARALPELDAGRREAVVRGMYLHLGRSFVELLRNARKSPERLERELVVEGRSHLERALAEGRGVLVLSAHLGNFELLVRVGLRCGAPVHVVTKRFRSAVAERIWRWLRVGGASLLPAEGSGRAIVRALKRGEVVAFVLDQHAPGGVRVPFFERPASTSPDLARLAAMTGAPVVPVFTCREADGRHRVEVGAPLELPPDPEDATGRCVAVVEAAIRDHPDQWLWLHRRWK